MYYTIKSERLSKFRVSRINDFDKIYDRDLIIYLTSELANRLDGHVEHGAFVNGWWGDFNVHVDDAYIVITMHCAEIGKRGSFRWVYDDLSNSDIDEIARVIKDFIGEK